MTITELFDVAGVIVTTVSASEGLKNCLAENRFKFLSAVSRLLWQFFHRQNGF